MTVIRAKTLGICAGVRHALELAQEAGQEGAREGKKVLSYGPLIHNRQVTERLEKSGVGILDTAEFDAGKLDAQVDGAIVTIRAHGAPPEVFEHLERAGARVVDATCPRVLRSQKKARELAGAGYSIVVAGDADHAEVAGLVGQVSGALVVQNEEEAKQFFVQHPELKEQKLGILAQSTIQRSEYEAIVKALKTDAKECLVVDTLCPASEERQAALSELLDEVSGVIVVGGKNSANTQRLATKAREAGKPCWHIETAAELPPEVFSYDRIGLTAGASTPDFMVDDVEAYLLSNSQG